MEKKTGEGGCARYIVNRIREGRYKKVVVKANQNRIALRRQHKGNLDALICEGNSLDTNQSHDPWKK